VPEYADIFEPKAGAGLSGFAHPPRPFVIPAAHLDGQTIRPDAAFHFEVHLFDTQSGRRPLFIAAFTRLAEKGLGPVRARTQLLSVDQENIAIDLNGPPEHAARIRVQFLTPTELKSRDLPSRDRFSTLRSLYGPARSISISAPWANAPLQPHRPNSPPRRIHRRSRISSGV